MLNLEPEIAALRPHLGDAAADALIARERRDVFSIYPELRICGWVGATMLAGAAGILLKNNLERIGPIALATGIAIVAAACYAFVTWRRARASAVDDYVLLLGALLVSADVAFIESQFHLFDEHWKRHLLVLAVVHGLGAYAYGSRMLLSLSITALAGWLGVDRQTRSSDLAVPAFICTAILIAWRELDRRLRTSGFSRTFEHFAANIALTGALTLAFEERSHVFGALLTIAIAAAVIYWGFRVREEWFVLYAFVYAVIALDTLLIRTFHESEVTVAFILVASMIGAVAALLALHNYFNRHFKRLRR